MIFYICLYVIEQGIKYKKLIKKYKKLIKKYKKLIKNYKKLNKS